VAAGRTLPLARLRKRGLGDVDILDAQSAVLWCEGAKPLTD
jgi:hypothetical protein